MSQTFTIRELLPRSNLYIMSNYLYNIRSSYNIQLVYNVYFLYNVQFFIIYNFLYNIQFYIIYSWYIMQNFYITYTFYNIQFLYNIQIPFVILNINCNFKCEIDILKLLGQPLHLEYLGTFYNRQIYIVWSKKVQSKI